MVSTIIALAATTLMSANSQTVPVEWTRSLTVTDEKPSASSISPTDSDKNGVMLQCTGNTMSAVFAVEPIDFETLDDVKTSRSRKWNGKLFIDGELVDERSWVYLPAAKAAFPGSKLVATKVFNAIVTGKSVEFELGTKGRVRVFLPNPDDAFSAFAADCKSFRDGTL